MRDRRTRLLVVMARAEDQPGTAHWPCWLSHSPLLLMPAPICVALRADESSFLPICLLLLLLLAAPSCVKTLHRGQSCRLLKLLAARKLVGHARHLLDAKDHQVRRGA